MENNPIKWVKVESIFIFFVMIATAFMGQDYPQHQVSLLIKTGGFSSSVELVNNNALNIPIHVMLNFGLLNPLLFLVAILSALERFC
ncbi:hypothetical protein [Virgibacillus oceani]|uniref:hypothetical protein n=1 Tax=Virgibacillus oceani TaxID=1479511 RepID=UPI001664B300|nr:hypothetical protein [Virgibacillus oceani]